MLEDPEARAAKHGRAASESEQCISGRSVVGKSGFIGPKPDSIIGFSFSILVLACIEGPRIN